MPPQELELRCFCSRRPLLAICGRDAAGVPFVHLKVYKQGRIYGEMVATAGVVRLRCRECLRWHKVIITHQKVDFVPESLPESLSV